jgi:sugar phosphate isomerase/epimerase
MHPKPFSRRDLGKLALAALPLSKVKAARVTSSTLSGVKIGVITGSFRGQLPPVPGADSLDTLIAAMSAIGLSHVELDPSYIKPGPPARSEPGRGRQNPDANDDWYVKAPLDYFKEVRKRLDDAGIDLICYNLPGLRGSDAQLNRTFEIAHTLGVETVSSVFSLKQAEILVPYAEKHKLLVALHNHDQVNDSYEISTPATFREGMAMSKYFRVNLDTGHFRAAGCDPIAYIKENHAVITHLHLKDRQKDHGPNRPWGQGDTPLKEVLLLLRDTKYPIPAAIEYEYRGPGTPVDEVKNCFQYCKQCLA